MSEVFWTAEDGLVNEDLPSSGDSIKKSENSLVSNNTENENKDSSSCTSENSGEGTPDEVVQSMDELVEKVQEIRGKEKEDSEEVVEEDERDEVSERSWVEREFDTTKAVVRKVLTEKERARNSDKYLIWFIQHEVEGHDLNCFDEYSSATSPETIRRVRQEVQNTEGEFLPTDEEVIRQRGFKEEEIRDYFSSSRAEEIFYE